MTEPSGLGIPSSLLQDEQMRTGTTGMAEGQAQGSCRVVQRESSVSNPATARSASTDQHLNPPRGNTGH